MIAVAIASIKFHVGLTKNQLFLDNSVVFFSTLAHQITEVFVHLIRDLRSILVDVLYFLTKMVGQMTLFDVISHHYQQKWCLLRANLGLSNRCKFIQNETIRSEEAASTQLTCTSEGQFVGCSN